MKKFLIIFGSIVAIISIAVAVFLFTFDVNRYKSDIVVRLTSLLGRPVEVGQMSMKLASVPTVKIGKIKILNNTSDPTPFMDIDNVEVTLALAPLLSKRLEIKDISLGKVGLHLTQSNGKSNWKLSSQNATINEDNKIWLSNTQIESLSAKQVEVIYQGKVTATIPLMDLSIKHLKIFTVQMVYNGNVFQVSGTVNDLLDLVRMVPDYAFNLEVSGADMSIKINGAIGDTKEFKNILINASASGNNLKASLESLGLKSNLYPPQSFQATTVLQGEPALMEIKQFKLDLDTKKLNAHLTGTLTDTDAGLKLDGVGTVALNDWGLAQIWGVRPLNLQANVGMTKSDITVSEGVLQAGRTDARIAGTIALTEKPQINMSIASDYLNLQDVILGNTTYETDPNIEQKLRVALNRPIDWDWLNRFNGTVKVMVPHLQVSDNVMMGVYGSATVQNGVLSMNDIQMNCLNGSMIADLMLNANTHEGTLKMRGNALNLNAVTGLEYVIKDGFIDGEVNVSGSGNTIQEMLSHLNGTVKSELYKGRIISSDFSNLADVLFNENKHSITYTTADRESEVLCGAIDVTIHDGQIHPNTSQVALETSRINLAIDGAINFGNNELDVLMTPSSAKVMDSVVPKIKVVGAFLNPRLELVDNTDMVGPSGYTPYISCERILGHKTKNQLEEMEKAQRMLPLPQVQEEAKPDENSFQEQLIQKLKRRK